MYIRPSTQHSLYWVQLHNNSNQASISSKLVWPKVYTFQPNYCGQKYTHFSQIKQDCSKHNITFSYAYLSSVFVKASHKHWGKFHDYETLPLYHRIFSKERKKERKKQAPTQ